VDLGKDVGWGGLGRVYEVGYVCGVEWECEVGMWWVGGMVMGRCVGWVCVVDCMELGGCEGLARWVRGRGGQSYFKK
jgi:hypothetical protein